MSVTSVFLCGLTEFVFFLIYFKLNFGFNSSRCTDRNSACTHCTCSHGHDNAGEEGQVVARVHAVPQG